MALALIVGTMAVSRTEAIGGMDRRMALVMSRTALNSLRRKGSGMLADWSNGYQMMMKMKVRMGIA